MKKTIKKLLSIGVFTLSISVASAADIYVSASGDNSDGTSLANAYNSIFTAYNVATGNAEDDRIIISGTVSLTAPITLNDVSGNSVSFLSADDGFSGTQAIINNGGGTNRLFFVNASSGSAVTVFTGLEFTDIASTQGSGGFFGSNASSDVTFNSCKFTNLSTASADGTANNANGLISIINTTMTFNDCVFDGNSTTNGNGGVFSVNANGNLIITNSVFKNNSASKVGDSSVNANVNTNGGAITVGGTGSLTITGTTFYNNTTELQGGAIYMNGTGTSTLTNVTMFENSVTGPIANNSRAGGLRIEGLSTVTIKNSLFYKNVFNNGTADIASNLGFGGTSATITLINTLSGNLTKPATLTTTETASVTNADLDSNNLMFDAVLDKVTYGVATSGNSPIDFGDDGNDVGAWDSTLTQSPLSLPSLSTTNISIKPIASGVEVFSPSEISVEIYSLLGAKIKSFTSKGAATYNTSDLASGLYVFKIVSEGKAYAQKIILD